MSGFVAQDKSEEQLHITTLQNPFPYYWTWYMLCALFHFTVADVGRVLSLACCGRSGVVVGVVGVVGVESPLHARWS